MKFKALFIVTMVLLGCCTSYASSKSDTTNDYADTTIHGWKVHINASVVAHPTAFSQTCSLLDKELGAIEEVIPKSALPDLKAIPLWIDYIVPLNTIFKCYVETPDQLIEQGLNPQKAGGVGFQVTEYLNMPHDSLPLLKWLSFTYQYQVLGADNKEIARCFEHAKESGIYVVWVYGRPYFPYGNEVDYFASLSGAYFAGRLTYPPYNKEKLKIFDPVGYEMIEKMWKVRE
jgi:hypothetical protein